MASDGVDYAVGMDGIPRFCADKRSESTCLYFPFDLGVQFGGGLFRLFVHGDCAFCIR